MTAAPVDTGVAAGIQSFKVKDWMRANSFTGVMSSVKENENGYPYLVFKRSPEEPGECVYFSKSSSKDYAGGMLLDSKFFQNLRIFNTTNASNEKRWKIGKVGASILDIDLFED